MANLTKKDLVIGVHEKLGIPQKDVREMLQATFDMIAEALLAGKNVELRNFGIFEVQVRKSRIGRNPSRPEKEVIIPDRATVKFKIGKAFKKTLQEVELKKFKK